MLIIKFELNLAGSESCDDFKPQNHHFHWVPQFVPKTEDLDEAGLAYELGRRKREPLIGRPIEQRDEEEEAEIEEETEEKEERMHSLCAWDVETKRKKSRRRRCLFSFTIGTDFQMAFCCRS